MILPKRRRPPRISRNGLPNNWVPKGSAWTESRCQRDNGAVGYGKSSLVHPAARKATLTGIYSAETLRGRLAAIERAFRQSLTFALRTGPRIGFATFVLVRAAPAHSQLHRRQLRVSPIELRLLTLARTHRSFEAESKLTQNGSLVGEKVNPE